MMKHTGWWKKVATVCVITAGCLLLTTSVMAQSSTRLAGELSQAQQVTLNGTAAIVGITVFNHSRIKTSPVGAATINLGRRGRISLGPDTEMRLRFSEEMIGGTLISGRAVVSAAAGIKISILSSDATTLSDGHQASVLIFDTQRNGTQVRASLGQARIIRGRTIERITASGLTTPPRNDRRENRLFSFPDPSLPPKPPCSTFPKLGLFGTRLICRDYFNTRCLAGPSRFGICDPYR